MIASLTYEDHCDLTDGTNESESEADVRVGSWNISDHDTLGGGDMEAMNVGDGDQFEVGDPEWFEEFENSISRMTEAQRGGLAGYVLSSCSQDHALITATDWLCKCDPLVWSTMAREAVSLLSNRLAGGNAETADEAYRGLCEVFARVSPNTLGAVLLQPAEAE